MPLMDELEARFNAAGAMLGASEACFVEIVDRLIDANAEYCAVITQIDREIRALNVLRENANTEAKRSFRLATDLLDITRGYRNE
jgi:hypothetical protein